MPRPRRQYAGGKPVNPLLRGGVGSMWCVERGLRGDVTSGMKELLSSSFSSRLTVTFEG